MLGAANVLDVDAIEQHAQLRGVQRDASGAFANARKAKATALEPLITQDRMQALRPRQRILSV